MSMTGSEELLMAHRKHSVKAKALLADVVDQPVFLGKESVSHVEEDKDVYFVCILWII